MLLASATLSILESYWDSSQISCWCPVSWRACSFGSSMSVPSHTQAVLRCWGGCWVDGGGVDVGEDVGVDQLKALDMGLAGRWVGPSDYYHTPIPPGPASPLYSGEGQGHFSHTAQTREGASSPVPTPLGLAQPWLCYQSHLYCAAQVM